MDNGTEFEQVLRKYGIRLCKSIPCWPQAIGEVERMN